MVILENIANDKVEQIYMLAKRIWWLTSQKTSRQWRCSVMSIDIRYTIKSIYRVPV